jgi:hypothetical protein
MKTKRDIKILFENGLTFSTIKNLTPNQVKVLVEKFTKKGETKEQTAPQNTTVVSKPQQPSYLVKDNSKTVVNGVEVDTTGGKTVLTPLKEIGEETEVKEKFESRAQQKLFFAKCGNGKTKEQKKWCKLRDEFASSTTKKDYKKMPEKLHPEKTVPVKKRKSLKEEEYEKFLENRIVSLIERHVDPEMTKGELIQTIMEKVNKSENFVLKNPPKNTMFQPKGKMKTPIGKLSSISGEMKEMYGTETAPTPVKKPGTKEKSPGKKNPFEPKHNPKPKAGKSNIPSWLSWNKLGVKLK